MNHLLAPALLLAAAGAGFAADVYTADKDHSYAVFAVTHFGISENHGRFNDVAGELTLDADASKNQVKLTVKTATVDTNNAKRDDHLRSADFLNAKQFPEMTFVSTGWKATGDKTAEVTGVFTLRGTEKTITVPVTKVGEGENPFSKQKGVGYSATFAIKRSDYGMTGLVGPVGDEVKITVAVEAYKK